MKKMKKYTKRNKPKNLSRKGSYFLYELAWRYDCAPGTFKAWIKRKKKLFNELTDNGWIEGQRKYDIGLIRIIVRHLGEPTDFTFFE